MTKEIDANGFWLIKDNPITKEGVFPYLGKQISEELNADDVYMVLRPLEELTNEETIKSFDAVPFINDHEMLGDGFTKYDDRPAGGVLYNIRADGDRLIGDFKIYSEDLKNEISSGKKELSLGYLCEYELANGTFNGQEYNAIQRNIRGNHIALVDKGRMGADIRVYDKAITMDSLEIIPVEKAGDTLTEDGGNINSLSINKDMEQSKMESSELLAKVSEILAKNDFDGGDDEKLEAIKRLFTIEEETIEDEKEETVIAEETKKEENAIADETAETEKKEALVEIAKDLCGSKDEDDAEKKENAISEDAMDKVIIGIIEKRNNLVKEVSKHIGDFACDGMTAKEVSLYACKKLGLSATKDTAEYILKGYLAGKKNNENVYSFDSAVKMDSGKDKATEKYLKGL